MDDKKPDVAVGELLREIDDWITVYDPGDVSLAGHLLRRAHAALSALPAEPKQRQLMKFYTVDSVDGLIEQMERRIEKLQARLPALRDEQPRTPREG